MDYELLTIVFVCIRLALPVLLLCESAFLFVSLSLFVPHKTHLFLMCAILGRWLFDCYLRYINSLGAEVPKEINYNYTGLESESVSANSTCLPDFNISNLKGLKIANLNVNSLLKHIDEIRTWLFENPFDILAINESKIDPTIRDSEIYINNYSIVRFRGVALYIKNTIPYTERKDLVPDNLEMICVEINRQHSRPFLITTWYRPPNSELDMFNNFELFLFKCDMENKELIIVGDLNCDVNKVPPDSQTHKLQTLSSLYQLTQVINDPTRVTKQHPH